MTRRTRHDAEAPGQDSFLDIVANLVGILIILVMVVGVRAKDAMLEAAPVDEEQPGQEQLRDELEVARSTAQSIESDIHQLDANIERQELEVAYRRRERDKVQFLVAAAEAELARRRDQLDGAQARQFDTKRRLLQARNEVEQLRLGIQAAENATAPVNVIEHLPTPMAKTVFGKELHFRLERGRLAYVPWDELVDTLQDEVQQQLWRLREEPEITETLGPIGGFWMKYTLKRVEHNVTTNAGVAVQRGVELDHFVLLPVTDDMGEPLEQARQPGSRLQTLLEDHRPGHTTVTVWTYPDSFDDFRKLKKELFQRGYLTASRPLPADYPIGGSPHGTRSAAQ